MFPNLLIMMAALFINGIRCRGNGHNGKALRNITDGNPFCQNDNECRHRIVILVKVVNDAGP